MNKAVEFIELDSSSGMAEAVFIKLARGRKYIRRDNWISSEKFSALPGWKIEASDIGGPRSDYFVLTSGREVLYIVSGADIGASYMGISVASDNVDHASTVIWEMRGLFPPVLKKDTDIKVDFWYMTPQGPQSTPRNLDAPKWQEIEGNYPHTIRPELSHLMSDWKPGSGGKLLLWQGPAGAGKTYAIRALAREWASWCKVSYITDLEAFFATPAYMLNVLLRGSAEVEFSPVTGQTSVTGEDRWHLVIMEDAGELIAKDAKQKTGAALSKLLNISDGLIGQGLRVLLLITTNEELGALHEAVSRPGRCASKLSFGELNESERRNWFEKRGLEYNYVPKTLAELYALERGQKIEPSKKVGFVPAKN